MAVRSTQCSTVVLSYLFLMFLVLLSTFDNIILIRSELVVSAINSQQHQQTQQIQQIQQHRKYYYHFRYNETSRSPSPQMTGLSKRRVDSDGDSAGSVVVDSDNVVEQQQQEQQQQHSDRQHKHEKLSGSSSSSSSSSNSIISSGIISNINSNSGSNKPLALKPLILLQQNIQQQQQQQQQQQLLEKQQQHQQDRHVVVGEKQQQQQQHSHSSINSFVHKDRDRENIVSSSASRTSAGGIISSRIAHQQLVRHNSDDENDDDDDDNSYDNKDDDDNNNIIKEVVSEEVYIYEYDFDIDNDRSSNNNNDDNSNKNNDYDEDEEDENSFGLEERENLIRHLEVSSSTIEFGVGHLCLSQNQTMDITNSDPDRSIQILAIRTDSPHFDCDFLSSYILKPMETITVHILYTPKDVGEHEAFFHLQVKGGGLIFAATGRATVNYYQLEPIYDQVPVDTVYSYPLYIYNPHNITLKITDIYTNGGSFYLSLPNSSTQQQQQQQQQPPPQQQQPTMTNQQQTSTTTTNILSLLKSKPSTQSSSPSKSSTQSSTSSISTSSNSQSPTTTISASNNDLTSIWEIQPYSKSHVINLYFRSSFSGQFTGIINIETNVENIQVPTEILSVGDGVHVSPSEIDFGYITSKTDFKSVTLYFLSANHDQDLSIMEIHPEVPDPNLRFFLHYDVISPGKTKVDIAQFFYTCDVEGSYSGKIILKVLGYKDIEVPYRAEVLLGDMSYHPREILFTIDAEHPKKTLENHLVLRNNFPIPLTINSIHIQDEHFEVRNASIGQVIQPNSYCDPILLQFNSHNGKVKSKHASLLVDTNISTFEIDLHAFDGHLVYSPNLLDLDVVKDYYVEEIKSIDFGVIGINETRKRHFKFKNPNPYPLMIHCFTGDSTSPNNNVVLKIQNIYNERGQFEVDGVELNVGEHNLFSLCCRGQENPIIVLDSGYTATFTLELTSPIKGTGKGRFVTATHLENLVIPFHWKVMDGSFSVKPSHVSFEPIILGGNSTQRLYANNTYGIPVHITSIDSSDPRVTCNMLVHTIPPRSYTHIANLVFEPKEIALDDVSAVFKELPNHQQILQYTTYDEIDEYFKRDAFWAVRQQLVVPSNIIIHTNLLSDYTIKTSGVVIPPSLLSPQLTTTTSTQTSSSPLEYTNHTTIDFGSVTISSQSSKDIEIYNPLDIPVVAELLPVETESRIYQYLKQIGFKTTTFQDSSPNHQQYHQQQHGIGHVANGFLPNPFKLSREALTPIVIPPKSTAQFGPIRFQPNNNTDFSSTLLLRNNYTVFHLIRLAGRGAGGRLAIVEDNYTEYNSILLELNKTHLSPCIFKKHNQVNVNSEILIDAKNPAKHAQHSSMSSMVANNRIEVSKTFTLMNKGNMPIDIKDVYLSGDLKCSGFGFSIANCKELRGVLSPGESIQFSVSYEPDFSTSLIKRELTFRTNQDTFYFTLIGAMPHDYLPLCTHLQPSFFYEYPAKTVFIISMVILFFVLIFLTFREYKPIRGVKYSFFSNSGNANTNNSNVNSRKDHHHNNNSHSLGSHADYHMLNQHDHHNHHHYLDNLPKSPDKSNVEFANKNNSGANNTNNNKKKKNNSSNNNKLSSSHDHNQHNDKPSNVHIDSSSIHNKKSFNNDHSQSDIHVSSSKQQLKQTTTTTAAKPTTSTTTSSNPSTSSSSSSTISPSLTASQLSTIPITISQSSSMSQQNLTSSTSSSASQDDDDTTIHEEIDGSSIGSSLSSSQEIVAPLNHISNSSSGNSTLITTIVEEDTIAAEVTKIINSKQYQQQDSNAVTKATTSNLFEQSPTKKKPATKHEVVNNDKPKIEVAATSKQRPKTQKLDLTNQPQPSSPLLPTQPAASATTTIPTTPTTPTTQTDHKKKSTLTQSTQAISTITNTLTNTPSIPTSTAAAQPSTTTSTTLTTTSKDFKQREPKPRKQYETKPKPQKVYVPKVPQPQQQQQQQTQQNMLSQQQQPLTTLPTQPIHSLAASTTPSYSPLLGSSGDNFSTLFSQQQQHHQFSHNIYNPFSFGMGNDLHHHNSASSWLSPNSLSPFQSPTNTPSTSTNTSADSIPLRTSTGSNSSGQQQMKDHGVIGSGKMANKSSYSNSNITQQLPTTHSQLTYRDSSINSIASDQLMLSDSDPFSWINRSLSGESTSSQYMMQSTPNMFDQFATPSNFQSSVPSNLTYQPTYDLFNNFYFNQPPPPTSPTTQQQNNNQNNNNKQQQQ